MAQVPPIDWQGIVSKAAVYCARWWQQDFVATLDQHKMLTSAPAEAPAPPEPLTVTVVDVPARPAETPAAPPERDRCPSCVQHKAMISAKGYVESVVLAAEARDGVVPSAMPATMYLARQELAEARVAVLEVQQRVPALAQHCTRVLGAVDQCGAALPAPASCTADACREALPVFTDAVRQSTELSVAYEDQVKRSRDNDRLRDVYENAKRENLSADEFYRRFREEMRRGR